MVRIDTFEVERWMDLYENTPGIVNIAETCAASISLDELTQLSAPDGATATAGPLNAGISLTYGAIRGSSTLRGRIAGLYEAASPDDIIVTQGAIGANFLTFYALVRPGDHVVCVYPTYQQLYAVPGSFGAEVSLWRLKAEDGFVPDVAELESLVKSNTKMIILNNPNNPTGAPIPTSVLREIVRFAEERDIIVFSDEVYRPLFHDGFRNNTDMPHSVLDLGYGKSVVTGSLSKAYALAGIRVGWVASRDKEIVDRLAEARDYMTISVSQLDDQVASYALSPRVLDPLLERNVKLAKGNAELLAAFVKKYNAVCSWQSQKAGTTAFIQFWRRKANAPAAAVKPEDEMEPVDDVEFCKDVLNKTKVFFVPGSLCFGNGQDFRGFVRLGYVCETERLKEALERLSLYVEQNLM